jgi:hypothetical protein
MRYRCNPLVLPPYDQNGNLVLDTDKNLPISYNFLNLPSQLGSLGILYDATGRKWRKAGQSTTTLYSNGIAYRDGKLEAIYLPDGRLVAEYAGSSITRYRAEYFHQDHPVKNGEGALFFTHPLDLFGFQPGSEHLPPRRPGYAGE